MDINVSSQIVVQTAAQWAADNTVYSAKRILVTSDVYYGSTDQRKFKIADGTQTWSNLDYMPIGQTLAQVLANGSSTNAVSFKSPDSLTELLVANNNIDAYVDNGSDVSEINITPTSVSISTTGTTPLTGVSLTANTVNIDSPTINLAQSTASRIVETDASKNLTYVAKGTAYNLNLGTTAGTVLEGNRITQVITNGVTDKAPSEDAVFDALALKRSSTYETLLFQGSFAATNLVDSIIYYFSNMDGLSATPTQSFSKFGFARDRKVTRVVLTCSQNVNYSNESVGLYLRKNATTDLTITTTLDLSTVGLNTSKVFYYDVDIDVTTGDNYEFKIVTPAFATNGNFSRWHIQLYGY